MMLPTFQHWVSFLQYKKIWPAKKKFWIPQFQAKNNCSYEARTTLPYVRKITQVKKFQQQLKKQQNINMLVITTKNLNINDD